MEYEKTRDESSINKLLEKEREFFKKELESYTKSQIEKHEKEFLIYGQMGAFIMFICLLLILSLYGIIFF